MPSEQVEIAVSQIFPEQKHARKHTPTDVAKLAESIARLGLLHPVALTPDYRLVAGLGRLLAFQQLGRQTIPAMIHEWDEIQAELAEIEENTRRKPLSAAQQAKQDARAKALYLALNPETGRGRKGGRRKPQESTLGAADEIRIGETAREAVDVLAAYAATHPRAWFTLADVWPPETVKRSPKKADLLNAVRTLQQTGGFPARRLEVRPTGTEGVYKFRSIGEDEPRKNATEAPRSDPPKKPAAKTYAEAAAEKTGRGKRTVQRSAAIGEGLPAEWLDRLADSAIANSPTELEKLAKLRKRKPDEAQAAMEAIAAGDAATVEEATRCPGDAPPADPAAIAADDMRRALERIRQNWIGAHGQHATRDLAVLILTNTADSWDRLEPWNKTAKGGRKR